MSRHAHFFPLKTIRFLCRPGRDCHLRGRYLVPAVEGIFPFSNCSLREPCRPGSNSQNDISAGLQSPCSCSFENGVRNSIFGRSTPIEVRRTHLETDLLIDSVLVPACPVIFHSLEHCPRHVMLNDVCPRVN